MSRNGDGISGICDMRFDNMCEVMGVESDLSKTSFRETPHPDVEEWLTPDRNETLWDLLRQAPKTSSASSG